MTYDWNQVILPGTIICSNYNTFSGDKKVGIFVVLYDEQNDNLVIDKKNVVCLKVSTKNTCVSNYSVDIDKQTNAFLDKDCIVCCSKLHTLHKQEQVYKILGRLNPTTYKKIYKVFNKFNNEINRQVIDNL